MFASQQAIEWFEEALHRAHHERNETAGVDEITPFYEMAARIVSRAAIYRLYVCLSVIQLSSNFIQLSYKCCTRVEDMQLANQLLALCAEATETIASLFSRRSLRLHAVQRSPALDYDWPAVALE